MYEDLFINQKIWVCKNEEWSDVKIDIDKIVWYGIIVIKEVKTWIVVNYRLYSQQIQLFICTLIKMKCT